VKVPYTFIGYGFVEPWFEIGCKARFHRRYRQPAIRLHGR
jgi:hypothetical protein